MEIKQHILNQWIKEEITREIRKYLEVNENKNTTYRNLWYTATAVLKGKFLAINTYIKKQKRFPINNLTLQFKALEKEE